MKAHLSVASLVRELATQLRAAAQVLALTDDKQRTQALLAAAACLRQQKEAILQANQQDKHNAIESGQHTAAFLDRLSLDEKRLDAMVKSIEAVAALPDPIGSVLEEWDCQGNGLHIRRVSVPLGVIGVIYEARPNVTADAAALCVKSANGCLLRCGGESLQTSLAICRCLQEGFASAGIPPSCVGLISVRDREAVGVMLSLSDLIDVIVPRGGASLIQRVEAESRIAVIRHLQGLCHSYIHAAADAVKARKIVFNAKMRRPGICGATETILVDKAIYDNVLPPLLEDLLAAGCELRGDKDVQSLNKNVSLADEDDWQTEYLDAIVSIRVVAGFDEAVAHIQKYSSNHTEAIITEDASVAAEFMRVIDSSIVMHNTSTQFADGGEFGMGAEIGISTNKLHARGPVGVHQLTSYKYCVVSDGSIRP